MLNLYYRGSTFNFYDIMAKIPSMKKRKKCKKCSKFNTKRKNKEKGLSKINK